MYQFCILLLIAIKVLQQSIKNSKWSLITPSSCSVTYSGKWNDPSWDSLFRIFQYKNGILSWLVNSYTNLVDFTEGVDVQGTSLELHLLRVLEKKSWNIKFGNWDNLWVENKFAKNTINSGWSWDHGEGMGVFAAGKFKRKPYQNN